MGRDMCRIEALANTWWTAAANAWSGGIVGGHASAGWTAGTRAAPWSGSIPGGHNFGMNEMEGKERKRERVRGGRRSQTTTHGFKPSAGAGARVDESS